MNKAHIVTVFGPTRSGKDTFISGLDNYLNIKYRSADCNVIVLSSIDVVKQFFDDIREKLGIENEENNLNQQMRQGLADIKAVLDNCFNWTVDYAISYTKHRMDVIKPSNLVLIYQVREVENISKLREKCISENIGYTSVFLYRRWKLGEYQPEGATTDQYKLDDLKYADVIVINKELSDLFTASERTAEKISHAMQKAS